MKKSDQKELNKLKKHVESCPSIPPDSLVSRIIFQHIDEKLNNPSSATNGYHSHKKAFPQAAPQDQSLYYAQQESQIWNTTQQKPTSNKPSCTRPRQRHRPKPRPGPFDTFFKMIRVTLLDLPTTLLFLSIITTHLMHKYYIHYITPMINNANWADEDNNRLLSEFTYYVRPCDESDVTASNIESLVLPNDGSVKSDDAVEKMMIHGMGLFQDILDEDVSGRLRTYIRKRNLELTNDEVIPLDTPEKRYSFGINANEDPSVAEALNQIGTHTLLKETLEKLLGKDPAVAEITAITVEPGAKAQGWHPDVKPEGNSLKYGQTFTHSYSLFIPLQNVTKRMGATELCPGTHYCAQEDLERTCVNAGFQASESNHPSKAWKTGDGLMMNQKMWHRGGVYKAIRGKENPDRVVFILTFISRPNFGKDHRQLSHGTYFHIHPFMYGHTFHDLKNAQISMSFPFSMLRSIGLWKPKDANWGYDWVTTTALRISNGENGYHYEDLEEFYSVSDLAEAIPSFLHGEVSEEGGWKLYIEDTIARFRSLFVALYAFGVFAYLLIAFSLDLMEGFQRRRIVSVLSRMLVTNLIIIGLAYKATEVVKETQFCKSVDAGTIYARPFLPKNLLGSKKAQEEKQRPTTVPLKSDVLFGNRYNSKQIGNYINFLNYHPGNKDLREQYESYAEIFTSYEGLPIQFQKQIVDRIYSSTDRFLSQNDFGEWTLMDEEEKLNQIILGLTFTNPSMGLINALDKELSILLSSVRFGTLIRSSRTMRRIAISSLEYFRDNVVRKINNYNSANENLNRSKETESNGRQLETPSLFKVSIENTRSSRFLSKQKRINSPDSDLEEISFKVGDSVLFNYQGSGYWIDGKVIFTEFKNYGFVERAFDDGLTERSGVYLKHLKPYVPFVEGDEIVLVIRDCPTCQNKFLPGKISRVYQDFSYDVEYENGDIGDRVDAQYIARSL